MQRKRYFTLSFSCPDGIGIVARVTGFFRDHGGWILRSSQHADEDSLRYFMRMEVLAESLPFDLDELRSRFTPVAEEFDMDWRIDDSAVKKRVVVLVSRQEHCLYDLLERWKSKELDIEIPRVISNHQSSRGLVEWHGIPYHYVPVNADNREQAFAEIDRLFVDCGGDTMVLARYMQILTPELCRRYPGRILNIHHSFLPSFVGARPYEQAYNRGVKHIGATCHYVTEDLDQGPIIEQDVNRIGHGDSVSDLVRFGKDIEKAVLARGLRYHLEGRVLINGNRTVVFR
ncbi:formyltetrahydrofolate deformylase [Flagellatimonas centrodinii]|uniref:formyltetrahydrofolate deformylase n=1 Tax=Flagellatimonas centrodinii TaxID=2806210 RepID=UPI001FEDC52D|nr:formyltetrahydrofolate deformylase [Flagellatimonas centrodinii]ULQ46732.1 formyltetrahydrofolate deformylase [Flagellatimonas centrodinii]